MSAPSPMSRQSSSESPQRSLNMEGEYRSEYINTNHEQGIYLGNTITYRPNPSDQREDAWNEQDEAIIRFIDKNKNFAEITVLRKKIHKLMAEIKDMIGDAQRQ
ncbi:hypothetical protein H1R20_g990, partial [Candolleomyces eurysporus]